MENIEIPKELLIYVPVFFALAKGIKIAVADNWAKVARFVPLVSLVLGGVTGVVVSKYVGDISMASALIGGMMMGWTTVGMNETFTSTFKKSA